MATTGETRDRLNALIQAAWANGNKAPILGHIQSIVTDDENWEEEYSDDDEDEDGDDDEGYDEEDDGEGIESESIFDSLMGLIPDDA
jgi:hypothetical protein